MLNTIVTANAKKSIPGTDLLNANLSGTDLSGANLSGAKLYDANLSNIETDNSTNFENVKLTSVYSSSIVTDIMARSIARESNANDSQ